MKATDMYKDLAAFYDRLTSDIDYKGMADFTLKAYDMHSGGKPRAALDLACGTGSFAVELAKCGIEVTGIDISPEMLSRAYSKSREAGLDILFLEQDICCFEIHGTVDIITCYLDSVNHILDSTDLRSLFMRAASCLEPGGLFIFDYNTEYTFKKIYSNNVFYESFDDMTYIWQNRYDKKNGTVDFELTFFVMTQNGTYARTEEVIRERSYPSDELIHIADLASLKTIAEYDGHSFKAPRRNSPRVLHVVKKPE